MLESFKCFYQKKKKKCYRCYQEIQKSKIKTLIYLLKLKTQRVREKKPEWLVFQREKEREKKVRTCEIGDWW